MGHAELFYWVETLTMIDARQQPDPDTVGEEFGGKWIAWDEENIHIVASGATADEAKQIARLAGVSDPVLEFVPPTDATFVGGV